MIYILAVTYQDARNWCHENDTDIKDTTTVLYSQRLHGIQLLEGDRIVHAPFFHRNPLYAEMVDYERKLRALT